MLIELLVATALTAAQPLPPLAPVPPAAAARARKLLKPPPLPDGEERLPNGGRACLIIARCGTQHCVLPARRAKLPQRRCDPPRRAPRVIPARRLAAQRGGA